MPRFRTVIGLLGLLFLWANIGQAEASETRRQLAEESTIELIKKRGVIQVGVSNFVPWVMRDSKGELIGFEIDIARKLAEDINVKLELFPTAFDGIIPGLLAGKFDIIITGISIQPLRALLVNYTMPYATSGQTLVGHKELTKGFSTVEDFNKPSVTINTRRGTVGAAIAQKTFPKATVRFFDEDIHAFQDVLNGHAHAMVALEPIPTQWLTANPDKLWRPIGTKKLTTQIAGMAVRKGDPDFLAFLNSWIALKQADGWLDERHNYWFGTNAWYGLVEKPPTVK